MDSVVSITGKITKYDCILYLYGVTDAEVSAIIFSFLKKLQKPSKKEPFDDESLASDEGRGRDAAG